MAKVILFSTTTCSWCRRAKKYLKENRIPFKEIKTDSCVRTLPEPEDSTL